MAPPSQDPSNYRRVSVGRRDFDAVIFDLDGVITDTAGLHADAWRAMFEEYFAQLESRGTSVEPYVHDVDYRERLNGKPRYDGVQAVLAARGIDLPRGTPEDAPGDETVCGLGNRKNVLFRQLLEDRGPRVFQPAVTLLRELRKHRLATAVVSSSRNCETVLRLAGLTEFFDVRVDGVVARRLRLAGKPEPETFLEAARRLRVKPARAVLFEDALAGVQAGHAGRFGLVVGVDRTQQGEALLDAGADHVVPDLSWVDIVERAPLDAPTGEARGAGTHDPRYWSLTWDRYQPEQEMLREALCTLGNGVFATRGAAAESPAQPDVHYPGTYLAGAYNRARTEISGRVVENEDLVNWPNWLPFSFRRAGQEWFSLDDTELLEFRQTLDMWRGVLSRTIRFRDRGGKSTRLECRRLVSMAQAHLAGIEVEITPEDWSGTLEVRAGLDGRVRNDGVARYRQLESHHLEPLASDQVDDETLLLVARTKQSRVRMAQAARTRLCQYGRVFRVERETYIEEDRATQILRLDVVSGQPVTAEKIVALYTSRDRAIADPEHAARKAIREASGFEALLEAHAMEWRHLWGRCDISIEPANEAQRLLRLHIFHLLQTVSLNTIDLDAGVPARGWHGEAYRGHIFWDEMYIFPFLNFSAPEITRALLQYRFRRLDEARRNAKRAGYEGAMYPWQSGSTGREETQELHLNPRSGRWLPDASHLQRHINIAIAYNIWQYYQATADIEFMRFYGAEMFVDIARFWASAATWDSAQERFDIRGVMGPDEYHEGYPDAREAGLDNNAYTNVMVAWLMRRALDVVELLPEYSRRDLWERLELRREEMEHWEALSRRLKIPMQDGIICQFEGYDRLQELDWDAYREKYGDIQRLDRILEAEGDSTDRYKLSKQADVLMLFYLLTADELDDVFESLGYEFDPDMIPRNVEYYLARTAHGSTLSRVVSSWVLARSDRSRSYDWFKDALHSDVADIQGGTTAEGIHLGAMAGTVDLLQRCYAGISVRRNRLHFEPRLPDDLRRLRFRIRYRGRWVAVELSSNRVRLVAEAGADGPILINVDGMDVDLDAGERREIRLG